MGNSGREALSNRDVRVSIELNETSLIENGIAPSFDCHPMSRCQPHRQPVRRVKGNRYHKTLPQNKISDSQCPELLNSSVSCSGASKSSKWPNIDGETYGMAACPSDGTVAVVYYAKSCIHKLDNSYNITQIIDCSKIDCGWSKPAAAAFDSEGNLYVTDIQHHNILKFDHYGNYEYKFSCRGSQNGQLDYPTGISVASGLVYVADSHNKRISVFKTDGRFQCTIGSGILSKPYDVSIDDQKYVVVADMGHKCVYVFTSHGDLCSKYGMGQFQQPQCLTIFNGFTYVIDSFKHKLMIFDINKVLVYQCSTDYNGGHRRCPRVQPLGITVTSSGRLLVSGDCICEYPQIYVPQ